MRIRTHFQEAIYEDVVDKLNNGERRFGLFTGTGSGKTKLAIDIARYLITQQAVSRIVVVAPTKSIGNIRGSWPDQIQIENVDLKYFTFVSKSKLECARLEFINTGTYTTLKHADLLIIDEAHFLKNPTSQCGKNMRMVMLDYSKYVLSLTATPRPNSALDWYMQCVLTNSWYSGCPTEWSKFKYTHAKFDNAYGKNGRFPRHVGDMNEDKLLEELYKRCYMLGTIGKIPSKQYELITYNLCEEQIKAYRELKSNDKSCEINKVLGLNYLFQRINVCSGYIHATETLTGDEISEIIYFNENPKLNALNTLLDTLQGQFILFCISHVEMKMLSDLLNKRQISYSEYTGKLSNKEKEKAIQVFQKNQVRCFLATGASAAESINLQNCNQIIYFSNTFSYKDRIQSEGRICRIGSQYSTCFYYDIVSNNGMDVIVLNALRQKEKNVEWCINKFAEIWNM